jgi:predicted cupin superfamily sugar epimerase
MVQHIEGGWYNETYRSDLVLEKQQLPGSFNDSRNICTHIYFLLEKHGFSAFHRIKSDELWHFYYGDPLIIYEIDGNGHLVQHLLGNDADKQQSLFCVVKKDRWFGSRVADGGEFGLAGCTVSPGFDFHDFELAEREILTALYPQHGDLIRKMTSK